MGLFAERSEKEQAWAVLPGEPFAPESDAERLDALPTASPTDLGSAVSIAIPMPTVPELTSTGDTDAAESAEGDSAV